MVIRFQSIDFHCFVELFFCNVLKIDSVMHTKQLMYGSS